MGLVQGTSFIVGLLALVPTAMTMASSPEASERAERAPLLAFNATLADQQLMASGLISTTGEAAKAPMERTLFLQHSWFGSKGLHARVHAELVPNATRPFSVEMTASKATIYIHEWTGSLMEDASRDPTSAIKALRSFVNGNSHAREANDQLLVTGLSMRADRSVEGASKVLVTVGRESTTELGIHADASCPMEPSFGGWSQFERLPFFAAHGAGLRVGCDASSWQAADASSYAFWGLPLRLEFESTDASGTKTRTAREILTGKIADEGIQRLVVVSPSNRSAFSFDGTGRVELRAPALRLSGTLVVPGGNGSLTWGAYATREGQAVPAFAANGDFLAQPNGDRSVHVHGMASGPVAPRSFPAAEATILLLPFLLFLIPVFTRLRESQVLNHNRRRSIYDVIHANPGIQIGPLAHTLGLRWQATKYHLSVLTLHGLVQVRKVGGAAALFASGAVNYSEQPAHHLARKPLIRALLLRLRDKPDAKQDELATHLGVHQPYVSILLRRAQEMGLIQAERAGRSRRYIVTAPRAIIEDAQIHVSGQVATPAP